ncbi:RnfH family protein [Neisseria meningitidis]|uniref:RnfH family protein n=1 Tax=Neisseria meningitidis TaxID=487 RepID=UPI001C563A32|nr:RnfH family protein [Neisseria meningitidis]MBW4010834.1 RnfH family protein [Neisseria meningitidis]
MLEIEIVYGLPDRQALKTMQLAEGTTVRAAALKSGLDGIFEDLNLYSAPLGIFGKAVKDDTPLRDGDRIEVYRPLLIDPKEARRKRVQNQE